MSQAAGQDPGKPTIGDVREAHRLDEAALDRAGAPEPDPHFPSAPSPSAPVRPREPTLFA